MKPPAVYCSMILIYWFMEKARFFFFFYKVNFIYSASGQNPSTPEVYNWRHTAVGMKKKSQFHRFWKAIGATTIVPPSFRSKSYRRVC